MTHVLQLLPLLILIIAAAKLAGTSANRPGPPAVFGEIPAGLLLGPRLASGLICREVFSASVIMVLVTTVLTPPLLRLTFPPPTRRRGRHGGGDDCGTSRRS